MIKFISLEHIQHGIEVVANGAVYDLHNAADFTEHHFDSEKRHLTLSWDYWDYDTSRVVSKIWLTFSGVESLVTSKIDESLPEEEGLCLERMTVDRVSGEVDVLFRSELGFKFKCTEITFRNLKV